MTLFAAGGIGLASAALFLLLYNNLRFNLHFRVKARKPARNKNPNAGRETLAVLVGMVALAAVGWGSRYVTVMAALGAILGLVIVRVLMRLKSGLNKEVVVKEIVAFFEAVELYIRAGYALPQAMDAAKLLTPHLRRAVDACLGYWPSGSRQALEVMRQQINLPEADLLVSLLGQVDRAGIKNLEGVIQREAHNLERLRQLAVEVQIARRPFYFTLYRALPLMASVSIIVGPLLYRVVTVLRDNIGTF